VRSSTVLKAVAAVVGLTALVRQHRESVAVRAGRLRPLGPAGRSESEDDHGDLHRLVRTWQPQRPRTRLGRMLVAVWTAPLTALGAAAALLGGSVPRWDPALAALVARSVRGPARWFLRRQGATAATLGHVVVVRDAEAAHALLVHEAQHTRQQERLGLLFGVVYPVASACWGYRDNPFEVAARSSARVSAPPRPS
jgi:hypothetical protein